jgi:hypothetical protein
VHPDRQPERLPLDGHGVVAVLGAAAADKVEPPALGLPGLMELAERAGESNVLNRDSNTLSCGCTRV